jgi:hypothetical protein
VNDLNLGRLEKDGPEIPNVILPPWAKGSATNFIEIHRQALGEFFFLNLRKITNPWFFIF